MRANLYKNMKTSFIFWMVLAYFMPFTIGWFCYYFVEHYPAAWNFRYAIYLLGVVISSRFVAKLCDALYNLIMDVIADELEKKFPGAV